MLVSVIVVAYNQERYIREAVRAALAQTYSPLEIIISDDCSTDSTLERAREVVQEYSGPHAVKVLSSETNLGFARHLSFVNKIARGELIVVAAGDDISLPARVSTLVTAVRASGSRFVSAFSNVVTIDADGNERGLGWAAGQESGISAMSIIRGSHGVIGAAQAWSRNVFDSFGPLNPGLFQEDAAIPFRAAIAGEVIFVNEALVRYRRHSRGMWSGPGHMSNSASARRWFRKWARNLIALNIGFRRDLRVAIDNGLISGREGAELRKALERRRWEVHAEYAIHGERPLLNKVAIVAAGLLKGINLRKAARWLLMLLAMRGYLFVISRRR